MTEIFKITHIYYDSDIAVELPLHTRASTRENLNWKIIAFIMIEDCEYT